MSWTESTRTKMGRPMRALLPAALVAGAMIAASSPTLAHHSFTIFDTRHPLELEGTVQEFRFTNPHTYIVLEVKGRDGGTTVWNLEGASPSILVRDGWSSRSLKAGDEIMLTIDPLRSGAPGGAWTGQKINFRCGRPIACCTSDGL
jgi:hypothetical protein